MALVSVSHVSKSFDATTILHDVTVDLERGRKIGLIGQNGTGKSTLLKLIAKTLEVDDGEIFHQRGLRFAVQAQELDADDNSTVIAEMRGIFREDLRRESRLREMEERLTTVAEGEEQAKLLRDYSRLQDEHEAAGGYDIERRIETVLTGLGLPTSAWDQPISDFSGGERNIIGLARALLSDPELLLLDEPSNHLDMDGVEWFVRFMRNSPATILMVSHNRHLLDAAVDEIWELRSHRVTVWPGNYSDFEQRKAETLALQERQYKNQQRTIKRLEFQARRLRDMARAYDDPGQAKRAKSMLKRIENMDKVERPDDSESRFHATLSSGSRHGHMALQVENFSFAYGDRVIFEPSSLDIQFGDRVCLVGPNGCGKTTLFREILEKGSWENPMLRLGKSVKVGDYNQFHAEAMDVRKSLVDWLQEITGLDYQPTTELLHRFLFVRDDLDREISSLSGGEKSRLQLARLVHEKVNFLMLDEPTNHLDIQASDELESMLEEFDGTLFIISHDRYFLERMVDHVVEVKDRKLVSYHGNFQDWWDKHQREREGRRRGLLSLQSQDQAQRLLAEPKEKASQDDRNERKSRQREIRRLKRDVENLETAIAGHESSIANLEAELEEVYSEGGDAARGPVVSRQLDTERKELELALSSWEEQSAKLEALEA
ncbi:MAG: ATP-binding cassette domain-containing protein [Planctomycetota bacterium]